MKLTRASDSFKGDDIVQTNKKLLEVVIKKTTIIKLYYSYNFTNLFFGSRNTIEFRLQHAVLDDYKVANWLMMCIAMVIFAEKNEKRILTDSKKITLAEVMESLRLKRSPNTSGILINYLKDYIENRKTIFNADKSHSDNISKGDYLGQDRYSFESIFNII